MPSKKKKIKKVKPEKKVKPIEKPPRKEPKEGKKAAKAKSTAVVPAAAPAAEVVEDVMLGYYISSCVGIQHYRFNGARYNKEPLLLRREPHNPYDRNAIGVYTTSWQQVGHVVAKTGDVAVLARVADDPVMRGKVRMLGQVEGRANQIYKFPLRISFFGPPSFAARVHSLLGRGGLTLIEPKRRVVLATAVRSHGGAALAAGSGAPPPAAVEDDDDEVECVGEKSWAERDAELRAQAIVLE